MAGGTTGVKAFGSSLSLLALMSLVMSFTSERASKTSWTRANSRRAAGPRRKLKREPVTLVARWMSMMPKSAPNFQCSFGVKSNSGFLPQVRMTTLSESSLPMGVSSEGRLGIWKRRSSKSAWMGLRSASRVWSLALICLPLVLSWDLAAAFLSEFRDSILDMSDFLWSSSLRSWSRSTLAFLS